MDTQSPSASWRIQDYKQRDDLDNVLSTFHEMAFFGSTSCDYVKVNYDIVSDLDAELLGSEEEKPKCPIHMDAGQENILLLVAYKKITSTI